MANQKISERASSQRRVRCAVVAAAFATCVATCVATTDAHAAEPTQDAAPPPSTTAHASWTANDDELVTDRPDAAESPLTVGFLRWQLESGVDVADTGDTTQLSTPTKLRFGVWHWAELHVETDGFVWTRSEDEATDDVRADAGGADMDVGTKIEFPAIPNGPTFGLLVALTMPVGADGLSGDHWSLSPTIAMDQALADDFGLAVNLGVTTPLDGRDTVDDALRWAVAVGWTVTPLTDRLGVYLETFAETALTDAATTALYIDGGLTYLITPGLQIDAMIRGGLVDAEDTIGGGGGLSLKL